MVTFKRKQTYIMDVNMQLYRQYLHNVAKQGPGQISEQ